MFASAQRYNPSEGGGHAFIMLTHFIGGDPNK